MQLAVADWQELQRLEEELLWPDVRRSPEAMAVLLAEDLREFGQSGRVYDKAPYSQRWRSLMRHSCLSCSVLPQPWRHRWCSSPIRARSVLPVARPGRRCAVPCGGARSKAGNWCFTKAHQ